MGTHRAAGKPRHRSLTTALAFGLMLAFSIPAFAGVERYQFTDYSLDVEVNGTFEHQFDIRYNPCTDTFSGSGYVAFYDASQTLSNITLDGTTLSFTAVYDSGNTGYTWYPAFDLDGGSLKFSGSGPGVTGATGAYSMSQTDYNHGEYVAESIDGYGPDAKSCIGMPIVANGPKG